MYWCKCKVCYICHSYKFEVSTKQDRDLDSENKSFTDNKWAIGFQVLERTYITAYQGTELKNLFVETNDYTEELIKQTTTKP